MSPFFSVIVPTFNRAPDLYNCLTCLTCQAFKNFEVIISDDGSTDNTRDIVNLFRDALRILYLYDCNSGGPAKPRNNGIAQASGEWLAFLDSDDLWYEDKLTKCYEVIKGNEKLDFLAHDLVVNNSGSKQSILSAGPVEYRNFYLKLLINGNRFPNSSIVVRNGFLSENNLLFSESSRLTSVEDYDFVLKIAKYNARMMVINTVLGEYKLHENNISGQSVHLSNLKYLLLYHAYFELGQLGDSKKVALKAMSRYYVILANNCFKIGRNTSCLKLLVKSFCLSPMVFFNYLVTRAGLSWVNLRYRLDLSFKNYLCKCL